MRTLYPLVSEGTDCTFNFNPEVYPLGTINGLTVPSLSTIVLFMPNSKRICVTLTPASRTILESRESLPFANLVISTTFPAIGKLTQFVESVEKLMDFTSMFTALYPFTIGASVR